MTTETLAPALTPTLKREAYYGVLGDLVDAIEPYTEAHPAAVLAHLVIALGNLLGRGPYALVESTRHHVNEYACLVGPTAKGRKGQAWSTPERVLAEIDAAWTCT